MPAEKVRLRIGNLAKAVLVSGQAYQDPKDALNEFVSNAADDYAEAERRGERIRVVLRRKGRYPMIAVDDIGRGMSPNASGRSLATFSSPQRSATIEPLARRRSVYSPSNSSACVAISCRGPRGARIPGRFVWSVARRRPYSSENGAGSASFQGQRSISQTLIQMYSEFSPNGRSLTTYALVGARRWLVGTTSSKSSRGGPRNLVLPEKPEGVRLMIPARNTLWGRVEFVLYVAAPDGRKRRVAVVGRAATSVVDDLSELDEFSGPPWDSDQVSGQVMFEALQQSAGRRAILRDREAFPLFVDAVKAIEPAVTRTVERVAREVDAQTADRLSDVIRRIFGRVLKELADLDNPMLGRAGSELGEGAVLELQPEPGAPSDSASGAPGAPPDFSDLLPPPIDPVSSEPERDGARPDRPGGNHLPTVAAGSQPRRGEKPIRSGAGDRVLQRRSR